jgi:UDP-N-acetylmuramate dehydrogenase
MTELFKTLRERGINIKENVDLADYTTMHASANASLLADVKSVNDLIIIFETLKDFQDIKWMVLGTGSNTFFANDFKGLILKMMILGKEIVKDNSKELEIKIGAGEDWHEFVTFCVDNNYQGIENLALIPGTVGAAPVQNVAAYGQNLEDVFISLEALNIETNHIEILDKEKCNFGYRSSAFKAELKGKYAITSVTLKLKKDDYEFETNYHERKGRYGSLQDSLIEIGAKEPYSIKDIYLAVINIRNKKLPRIEDWGTVGSFFVNPMITKEKFIELTKKIPELQSYPVEDLSYRIKDWNNIKDDYVKIPAGRLLDDELGWRGKWIGNVGTFDKHALCVITNKNATGKEIIEFTDKMKKSVRDAYGIELESEVNIVE